MGRRIRVLGIIMIACLGLVIAQLVNIQLVKGQKLQTSPNNPRIALTNTDNKRGEILASDGTVLAESVPTPANVKKDYPYQYVRVYPQKNLFSGITGYDSVLTGASTDIENYYDSYLKVHTQPAQTLPQILFREKLPTTTDSVTLTVNPALQQEALNDLLATPGNNDGAVVVIQPKTGAVLAAVSNPNFDPNALTSTSQAANNLAYAAYTKPDGIENFFPLRPLFDSESFFPGSTMKVVTSTAAYNLKPNLIGFSYSGGPCLTFSDSNKQLCNDAPTAAGATNCGGTMVQMLPESCDPGYGALGIQEGTSTLRQQAELFGINSTPPIDLPAAGQQPTAGVIKSTFCLPPSVSPCLPLPTASQALQAYSSIGQETIRDTPLQNAMVAAGIANGGVIMTPHFMSSIRDSNGALVKTYTPTPMARSASAASAQAVTALMESVPINGTASQVGFPSYLCAAVKTGTAQLGRPDGEVDDWMIGFAPANNPQIAVAVVVPFQANSSDGAGIAGPIVNKVMQFALPPGSVQQPCNVQAPPSSAFGG